jgi:hypothetical protein
VNLPVDCNDCGASLLIGPATRYATCTGCRARLSIQRAEGSIFTELIESAEDREPEAPTSTSEGSTSEAWLRVGVGAALIASDLYWWLTDPSMQQLYVRIVLLIAGAWLVLGGLWKAIRRK